LLFLHHGFKCFPQYLSVTHPKCVGFAASSTGIYPKFTPSIFIDYQQRFGGNLSLKMDVEHSSEMPKSFSKPTWAHKPVEYYVTQVFLFLTRITITTKQHVEFYLQIVVFCLVTPCSFVDVYRYVRRTSSLH